MTETIHWLNPKLRIVPGVMRHAWRPATSVIAAACMSMGLAARAAPTEQALARAAPAGAAVCAACHGAQGEGNASGVPRLAGQNADYLAHALAMFKAGTRNSPIMQPIAGGLSEADAQALAGYFADSHVPSAADAAPSAAGSVAAGAELARAGSLANPGMACFSCHGVSGHGVGARYPNLAGQPAAFVIDRLHEFQARAKAKAPEPGTMTAVAAQMDEAQIRQAAAYLATLPPP